MDQINFTLPYQPSLFSSNRKTGINRNKKIPYFKNAGYSKIQEQCFWIMKGAFLGIEFKPKEKVYVSAYVYKKDNRSDHHNCIKGVLDAMQKAIDQKGVTDNYYVIASWDYGIDKDNPRIEMEVWQN